MVLVQDFMEYRSKDDLVRVAVAGYDVNGINSDPGFADAVNAISVCNQHLLAATPEWIRG